MNPDYHSPGVENLTNVNIIKWSDDSTELLSNIRKNMKCGGGDPVYRPCKSWFSFMVDHSNALSETDFNTQLSFLYNEFHKMNRPDKIQVVDALFPSLEYGFIYEDWNSGISMSYMGISGPQHNTSFSLSKTLKSLSHFYYNRNITNYQPPLVTFVFIPTTACYENYGGAEEVAQKLKNAGFQLTFFLMGADVDETKLTNYTSNFVYWRNMSNPQPENWDQVRLQAYGCNRAT